MPASRAAMANVISFFIMVLLSTTACTYLYELVTEKVTLILPERRPDIIAGETAHRTVSALRKKFFQKNIRADVVV